jgi:hypothetical protein
VVVNRKCYTRHGDAEIRPTALGLRDQRRVEVIGDRWSLLILRDVMFGNRRHFRVLQERAEEGIASNILGDLSLGAVTSLAQTGSSILTGQPSFELVRRA